MVIREGSAWGLIIKSGRMPLALNGMSSSDKTIPHVPFWPAREANLSPMLGIRSSQIRILTVRLPIGSLVIKVLSTYPI